MKYIGKLDKNKLGYYKNKIISEEVILTEERIKHIDNKHPGAYNKYIDLIPEILNNPDYILKDKDKIDTILILKTIKHELNNIQIVVKLQTDKKEKWRKFMNI